MHSKVRRPTMAKKKGSKKSTPVTNMQKFGPANIGTGKKGTVKLLT